MLFPARRGEAALALTHAVFRGVVASVPRRHLLYAVRRGILLFEAATAWLEWCNISNEVCHQFAAANFALTEAGRYPCSGAGRG
eukprot:6645379-Alexandrium_andersonii.AAC.1